jgi:hypothetical protein
MYQVHSALRTSYLSLADDMKKYFLDQKNIDFSVYEQKGKENNFSEVFIFENEEEFETYEDGKDEQWAQLEHRLEEYVLDGKMQYSVLIESVE